MRREEAQPPAAWKLTQQLLAVYTNMLHSFLWPYPTPSPKSHTLLSGHCPEAYYNHSDLNQSLGDFDMQPQKPNYMESMPLNDT